jgi:hypothetical protein
MTGASSAARRSGVISRAKPRRAVPRGGALGD